MTEEELQEMEKSYRDCPGRENFDSPLLIAEVRRLKELLDQPIAERRTIQDYKAGWEAGLKERYVIGWNAAIEAAAGIFCGEDGEWQKSTDHPVEMLAEAAVLALKRPQGGSDG